MFTSRPWWWLRPLFPAPGVTPFQDMPTVQSFLFMCQNEIRATKIMNISPKTGLFTATSPGLPQPELACPTLAVFGPVRRGSRLKVGVCLIGCCSLASAPK